MNTKFLGHKVPILRDLLLFVVERHICRINCSFGNHVRIDKSDGLLDPDLKFIRQNTAGPDCRSTWLKPARCRGRHAGESSPAPRERNNRDAENQTRTPASLRPRSQQHKAVPAPQAQKRQNTDGENKRSAALLNAATRTDSSR